MIKWSSRPNIKMHIKKAPYESGVFSMGWGRIKAEMSHLDGFRAGVPAQAQELTAAGQKLEAQYTKEMQEVKSAGVDGVLAGTKEEEAEVEDTVSAKFGEPV